jgi:hypothetical protein
MWAEVSAMTESKGQIAKRLQREINELRLAVGNGEPVFTLAEKEQAVSDAIAANNAYHAEVRQRTADYFQAIQRIFDVVGFVDMNVVNLWNRDERALRTALEGKDIAIMERLTYFRGVLLQFPSAEDKGRVLSSF